MTEMLTPDLSFLIFLIIARPAVALKDTEE
jgi:hypothetical protein